MLQDYRLFLQEFRRNFHHTGAIAPSGPWLAGALSRHVDGGESIAGRRILEVGPGTGAVTQSIVRKLRPQDSFTLVELNDSFVKHLHERFASEPEFLAVADRSQILHQPVEDLPCDEPYDIIISGLPLNNFEVADVERILAALERLLAPGGSLSFFEYIAVRSGRSLVSGPKERQRLQGIGRALSGLLSRHGVGRDWVWANVPPAWVHHVRLPAADEEFRSRPTQRLV
jgi:phosphatidylethanolamine/phosphatidyl-N-methylethanolamine N-methyltransferase